MKRYYTRTKRLLSAATILLAAAGTLQAAQANDLVKPAHTRSGTYSCEPISGTILSTDEKGDAVFSLTAPSGIIKLMLAPSGHHTDQLLGQPVGETRAVYNAFVATNGDSYVECEPVTEIHRSVPDGKLICKWLYFTYHFDL